MTEKRTAIIHGPRRSAEAPEFIHGEEARLRHSFLLLIILIFCIDYFVQ